MKKGPVILVGHSYGGAVITEAGNDPSVTGLVYITAFAPDRGESVASLIKNPAPGAPVPPILPPQDGFPALDKTKFAAGSAAPWGVAAQRSMSKRAGSSIVEVKGSHAVYVSQPEAVAEFIQKAAKSLSMK